MLSTQRVRQSKRDHRQSKRKTAMEAATQSRRWNFQAPLQPPQEQAPTLPSAPEQTIPPPNQVDTNETVKAINIMIYTYEGKVDENGVPITREGYATPLLDSSSQVKRTSPSGSSALKKKAAILKDGTIDVSMSMLPEKEKATEHSEKGCKKPNNNGRPFTHLSFLFFFLVQ
ncbi:hypothetical protein M3Y94_00020900 [Aphelenchoides besseyi]|nr:hypothetical protein M3Y94_00020900 [Aphelenchoides besseyi]